MSGRGSTLLYAAEPGDATASLLSNGDFETDADGDAWPDNWPRVANGGSWEAEQGNHFLRLAATQPAGMLMVYRQIPIAVGTKALQMNWRWRISSLKVGKQPWFDARILLEFRDASGNKMPKSPPAPYQRKDTAGWLEGTAKFLVPEGATLLALMPTLFQVEQGTFDLDDVVIKSIDPSELAAQIQEAADKVAKQAEAKRSKAVANVQADGSLIPNGDFETGGKSGDWPDKWGRPKGGGSWETEGGNHFLRITSTVPDQMLMLYQTYDIPAGIPALELTFRERVTGLKHGKMPWFDARILMEWKDASGKSLPSKPGPVYTQKDTKGWVEKKTQFLVPPEAVTLVFMPALFQVASGTFDLDDFSLKPTDPAPIMAAKQDADKAVAARYVPPEEPHQDKWPKILKVVGNRLHDPDGKDVWLQGVNAGGLASLPQDTQAIKSTVVAIDEWKANCVRLPMNEEFWYGKSPYQKDGGEGYRKTIDQIITLAANRGAYVVLDLHRFRAPKPEHAEFWKDAAAKYKDHPAVLFDIFNEPHGISWDVWKSGGFVGNKEGKDESAFLSAEEKAKNQGFQSVGMQGLVDAVRSTGANNIIIAGGLFWCNDLSGIVKGYALDDKEGNGIMYSWHTYNWHPNWARTLPVAEKYPIFLGEVGADTHKMEFIPAADQEDPYTFIPDMLGFIQKYHINWTGWCFHPKATPVMISDWNYTPTPYWGVFAKKALAGENFEMKRMR